MATGKSNARWIRVKVDNASGTLTSLVSAKRINSIGLKHQTQEVTAYSDGSVNITVGHPESPVEIEGDYHTTDHALLSAINGKEVDAGSTWTCTVQIEIGIKAAPTTGDPKFSGEYVCYGYTIDPSTLIWKAFFNVSGSVAPAWGTL